MKPIELTPARTTPDETEPLPQANLGNTVRASWNFSLDDLHQNMSRYEPDAKQVLIAAYLWCIDPRHPLSKPDFAERVGSSDNTLYKLYTGKYRHPQTNEQIGPSADLLRRIREFLRDERERFDIGDKDFVLTPTARKIIMACNLAVESRTPVFVVGPSHVGKTWTLEYHYTPNNNHGRTVYCRMEAASGLGGMVRTIAKALGISDKSNTADLVKRIKGALTKDMLLILDEVHLLAHTYRKGSFHNCMEVIREIHDVTKCGMVLCFTLLDDVRAAKQRELQQLWRRGVHKVFLPVMPTKQDLAMIFKHHGLEFPDRADKITVNVRDQAGKRIQIVEQPYEIVRQVAKDEALKAITERIRYAKKLANKASEKLNWKHFVEAHLLIQKEAEQEGEWV